MNIDVNSKTEKAVLAYSGGLDTSAIVVWLVEKGYEVHAVLVDLGQDEDLQAACEKAIRYGAVSATIADAKSAMAKYVAPYALGLAARYEGEYRLGTALARPFIAAEQVKRAKALGGATLVHGATGKGNDQIRFEFAYRSLAPECKVLAPWKEWRFEGRRDLVEYLKSKGFDDDYEVIKDYSLDENFWHLSVEGGELEDVSATVDVDVVLANVKDRFGVGAAPGGAKASVSFIDGVPTALDGVSMPLVDIIEALNGQYRHAPWAWDLIIENRFTGIKSRGVYINPAAKLIHVAVEGLARSILNKRTYEQWSSLGREYADILYRGEYFTDQRLTVESAARTVMKQLNGTVTINCVQSPYVASIDSPNVIFTKDLATFEASKYDHHDAEGFIKLAWLSAAGREFGDISDDDIVEAAGKIASGVRVGERLPEPGLVSSAV